MPWPAIRCQRCAALVALGFLYEAVATANDEGDAMMPLESAGEGLGPGGVLVLNYYQPWTYGGAERFTQLMREELRLGRAQAFVYATAAGLEDTLERNVRDPEYARLALYELVREDAAEPRSPYARTLTGPHRLPLESLVDILRPAYVRSHFPADAFRPVLETEAYHRVPFVYDIMDLWDDFAATPWGDTDTERWYVERADAIISVSQLLVDCFPQAERSYLVPNAVDRVFLEAIRPPGVPRPAGAPKRVLYMGSMGGNWFDWDLTRRLVRELPDCAFTFLGSSDLPPEEYDPGHQRRALGAIADLRAAPNVRFSPEVPHDQVARWLREADVGLIPFRDCDLVRAVSPLKVYEYLGAGTIVVQSGMPDIAGYPGVLTAHGHDEFVSLVRLADRESLLPSQAERIAAFARTATWRERLLDFDRVAAGLTAGARVADLVPRPV